MNEEDKSFVSMGLVILGYICALGLLTLISVPIYKSAVASGKIEYCYTEPSAVSSSVPGYLLYGFREWRSDRRIGWFPTLEETKNAAQKYGCELK